MFGARRPSTRLHHPSVTAGTIHAMPNRTRRLHLAPPVDADELEAEATVEAKRHHPAAGGRTARLAVVGRAEAGRPRDGNVTALGDEREADSE